MLFFADGKVRGALAGNGGRMAVPQKKARKERAGSKTGSMTASGKRDHARSSCRDGAERLRQAADKRVFRNSEKLADLLTAKALEGDLASAKVLVALAGSKKPIEESVKKWNGPSLAQQLAADAPWQGTKEDEDWEGGSKE
jgi:hypothetical protein